MSFDPGLLADPGAADRFLAMSIAALRRDFEKVLAPLDLVDGWKWWDWFDWSAARPKGVVQVLTVEAGTDVYHQRSEELNEVTDQTIFHWEWGGTDFLFYIDSWRHPELAAYVADQQELEWIRTLVAPDLAAVHREVFEWFAARGETLASLHWREVEELVAAAFAEQGMTVTLGPGKADGGIDLRLSRHEVFGDVLSAVQVKSGRTPVRLHYVQALAAASMADGNQESIFVTTSRYLPGAKEWAKAWEEKTHKRLHLASLDDVEVWCAAARDRLWLPDAGLRDPSPRGTGELVGRVLQTHTGYSITTWQFGLVVRQTKRAVLLRLLDTRIVEGDIQVGYEVPLLPQEGPDEKSATFKAARYIEFDDPPISERRSLFDTDGRIYSVWDGKPVYYNTMD